MIHIVSDGTLGNTTIVDSDTGNHLENMVSKINIEMFPGGNRIMLTIPNATIDVTSSNENVEVARG